MVLSDRIKRFDKNSSSSSLLQADSDDLYYKLCEILSQKIETIPIWFEYSAEEQQNLISNFVNSYFSSKAQLLEISDHFKNNLIKRLCDSFFGLGIFDLMLSKSNVKKIIAYSNEIVLYELDDGNTLQSDFSVSNAQYAKLVKKLKKISGKDGAIIRCRIKNILVTIFDTPICSSRFIIEKIPNDVVNFKYFEKNKFINSDVTRFLTDLIDSKVSFLVLSPITGVMETFVNAIVNELPQNERSILFLEDNIINVKNYNISVFDLSMISNRDKKILFNKYFEFRPSYVMNLSVDTQYNSEILSNYSKNCTYILPIVSGAPSSAISSLAAGLSAVKGISEKEAKTMISEKFRYIVQLDIDSDNSKIFSIKRIDTNKAGSLIIKDVLLFKNGIGNYEPEELVVYNQDTKIPCSDNIKKKIPFSARFE